MRRSLPIVVVGDAWPYGQRDGGLGLAAALASRIRPTSGALPVPVDLSGRGGLRAILARTDALLRAPSGGLGIWCAGVEDSRHDPSLSVWLDSAIAQILLLEKDRTCPVVVVLPQHCEEAGSAGPWSSHQAKRWLMRSQRILLKRLLEEGVISVPVPVQLPKELMADQVWPKAEGVAAAAELIVQALQKMRLP